jgi:hypothetical protein
VTKPDAASTNVASDSATVGMQAQAVHGDVTIYQLSEDASPQERYQLGVRYLDGGMPEAARKHLARAIAMGYETNEVRFHRLLALMSGRTIRQFSDEDFAALDAVRGEPLPGPEDEWANGVQVIYRLLDSAEMPAADVQLAVKKFDELAPAQRDKMLRHLEMFLEGNLEDLMWDRELERARREQLAAGREDRVWIYFQPTPAEPRVRPPAPVMTSIPQWLLAITAAGLFVAAIGDIGWELLRRGSAWMLTAYLISAVSGCVCAVSGLRWRSETERRRAKDKEFLAPRHLAAPPPGRFASSVDKLFSHYFALYVPAGAERKSWLTQTAGIRGYLRDELIDAYHETGVSAEEVAWLIRHRVAGVKRLWKADGLTGYRRQFRTRPATKAAFGVGLAVFAIGGFVAVGSATRTEPLSAVIATTVAVASGPVAVTRWLHILLERRRYAAEREETRLRLADSQTAFARWCTKLKPGPKDSEMAKWLDCDRKVLIDKAMQQYGVSPSRVITHAFLEAPAETYSKRARVFNGPWRYTRYHLLVFLLTADGVRQVAADLDFAKGSFHDWERTNYRFDAVAAVRVLEADDYRRTFELGLVSGERISIRVTEPSTEQLQQGEDAKSLFRVALDAAGLTNTLHVLEGAAAEGKEWIRHESRRGHRRRQARQSKPTSTSESD